MTRTTTRASSAPGREPSDELQWGHARSVFLERGAAETVVVKRFRHPRLLGRLRDRGRARAEYRWLRELHAHGVAVPEPLSLERRDGAWEVRMRWIEGALDLRALLGRIGTDRKDTASTARGTTGEPPATWPDAPERVARRLGALLAALHAQGVAHPDLHPGNVLVDPSGAVWAVDFHRARRGAADAARAHADLLALESALRERSTPRFRLRALHAWHAALPQPLRANLPALRALAERAAREAIPHRRHEAERLARRWLRESELCVEVPGPARTLLARGSSANLLESLEREVRRGGRTASLEPRHLGCIEHESAPGEPIRTFELWSGPERDLLRLWTTAARLEEHAVPAARPFALRLGSEAWMALALPLGARPVPHGVPSGAEDASGGDPPADAGHLCALLRDRGLAIRGPLRLRRAGSEPVLGPPDELIERAPGVPDPGDPDPAGPAA